MCIYISTKILKYVNVLLLFTIFSTELVADDVLYSIIEKERLSGKAVE
jgi:hypothetical protein